MLAKNNIYTYDDYLKFTEEDKVEIIDGHIYNMSPGPSRVHQAIISELSYELKAYIKSI